MICWFWLNIFKVQVLIKINAENTKHKQNWGFVADFCSQEIECHLWLTLPYVSVSNKQLERKVYCPYPGICNMSNVTTLVWC